MNFVTTSSGVGYVEGDEVVLVELAHPDLGAVLAEHGSLDPVTSAAVRSRVARSEAVLVAPLGRPGKIWGIGLNYRAKAKLNGRGIPDDPVIFLKAPSALGDPGGQIRLPSAMSSKVDYEGEVAIVIGTRVSGLEEDDAWSCVVGIMAANDVTARDVHSRTNNPSIAKSFDGFCPMGASLLSIDAVAKPDDIGISTTLNGEVVQDSSTSDLIFTVPTTLSLLSAYATLEPGDVVLTGTPPGTGSDLGRTLQHGDRVVVSVEGVLPLETSFVD